MQSTKYNENLSNYLREANTTKTKEHERSGKISPTKLTKPTLEAVLQLLDVPTDPPSDQSLRNFIRGTTLEEVAIKAVTFGRQTFELQATAEYRNCTGLIDVFESTPHEIKSAGFYTWRKVTKDGQPKHDHCIQAAYYAIAKNTKTAWIHYINADTFQVCSFRIQASEYKAEIDSRIDAIHLAISSGNLPDYTPLEEYHDRIMYSDYALFFQKKGVEAESILDQYYPEQYKLLKSKQLVESIVC